MHLDCTVNSLCLLNMANFRTLDGAETEWDLLTYDHKHAHLKVTQKKWNQDFEATFKRNQNVRSSTSFSSSESTLAVSFFILPVTILYSVMKQEKGEWFEERTHLKHGQARNSNQHLLKERPRVKLSCSRGSWTNLFLKAFRLSRQVPY